MTSLVVVLLSLAIHIGDCFNGQIRYNYDDVNDIVANHPVIKQLISRVDILEEKDRLNSEQIVKLTAQFGQCREDIVALQEKRPEVGEWKEGWNTPQNISDRHDGKQTTEQRTVSPEGNVELLNHLFLPSAVIVVSNIKLRCFYVNLGFLSQICSSCDYSQPFII